MVNKPQTGKTLRVCHIYYSRFIGDAILYREVKALKEYGFEIDVICLRTSAKEKICQTFEDYNLYCIQSRPSQEKKAIVYFSRLVLFFLKVTLLLGFFSIYKRYDIIHVTSPPDIMVFSTIIPKLFGSKIILDIHDIGPELFMRKLDVSEASIIIKLIKYLEKVSCSYADHVITVTDIWKEKLVLRSVTESKCSVLLNVPDDDIFKMIPPRKIKNPNNFILGYHGTIDEHFGIDTVLEAMPIILESIPKVKLHIYGDGRMKEIYEERTKKLGLCDVVIFWGTVPFYELPQVLSNIDVGIVPTKRSVFADELLAMKSLEYISLGIPIVISRTKGHDFYYDDSMVKFFEAENSADLASSVIELYQSVDKREKMVEKAQMFLQNQSWSKVKNKYYQIIEELL